MLGWTDSKETALRFAWTNNTEREIWTNIKSSIGTNTERKVGQIQKEKLGQIQRGHLGQSQEKYSSKIFTTSIIYQNEAIFIQCLGRGRNEDGNEKN